MTKNFKAVLFDLDGTLADTMPLLFSVYKQFLQRHGHEGTEEEFNSLVGPSLYTAVDLLNKKYNLGEETATLWHEYRTLLFERYAYDTKLFEGVLPFLSYAKGRGLRMGVVTSATKQLAQAFLDDKEIAEYFELIVTSDHLPESKPDPAIYRHALALLGLAPEEAVAIEDSASGVQSATTAGIYTLHITHQKSELKRPPGQRLRQVADWSEIQELFKKWE